MEMFYQSELITKAIFCFLPIIFTEFIINITNRIYLTSCAECIVRKRIKSPFIRWSVSASEGTYIIIKRQNYLIFTTDSLHSSFLPFTWAVIVVVPMALETILPFVTTATSGFATSQVTREFAPSTYNV